MPFDFFKYDYNLDGALHYPFVFDFKGINALLGAHTIDALLSGVSPLVLENAIQLNYLKLFGGTEQRNLPSEYTQLDYIESDGTQYIDTGILPNDSTGYKITLSLPDVQADSIKIGTRNDSGSTRFSWGVSSGRAYVGWGANYPVYESRPEISANVFNTVSVNYLNDRTYKLNNTTGYSSLSALGFTVANNFILFGFMYASTPYCSSYKLKEAIFTQGSSVTKHFVPAKRNSDNELGMYDTVTGNFFTNAGTGDFVAGPEAVPSPDAPMDIVCNNGVIKYGKPITLDSTRYYAYLSMSLVDWAYSNDSFSIVVPVTAGKKYKITVPSDNPLNGVQNTIFRYGFTDSINTDWTRSDLTGQTAITAYDMVRTTPQDTPSVEVTATHPYMIIQMGQAAFSYILANNLITVTDQTIYTDGTVETIALNGGTATAEMLLKVGDYKDVQSILDGGVTRKVGVKVLDGTEDWSQTDSYSNPWVFYTTFSDGKSGSGTLEKVYCTHFQGVAETNPNMPPESAKITVQGASPTISRFYVKTAAASTIELWKTYLAAQYTAGTPVIIIYPLATPTTESVAGQTLTASGNCTAEITQASINNLELEVGYRKQV